MMFDLAGRKIGGPHPPFVIAEAGINHNGDVSRAIDMVAAAKAAGADAVKFQTFRAAELLLDREIAFSYRSEGRTVTEPALAMFERCELSDEEWKRVAAACTGEDIVFLSTPQNDRDLALLLSLGVPAIKIGSDDFVNLPLVRRFSAAGLPLLLSCGMSDFQEISATLEAAGALSKRPVVLMLCTSEYPTPAGDVHARKLTTLRDAFPTVVMGYSDHTVGTTACVLALALGARVFEKHFTLDHDLPGPDHWFSANPGELNQWVRAIREAWTMLGRSDVLPTEAELTIRAGARRFAAALREIEAGERLDETNVGALRVAQGHVPAAQIETLTGAIASRRYKAGEAIRAGG